MTVIQIVLGIFLLFALSRVVLRFRDGKVKVQEFLFWSFLFTMSLVGVFLPDGTTRFAHALGIGRGADLVVYVSIVVLFYLVFRAYILMEDIRHELTTIIRLIALSEKRKK